MNKLRRTQDGSVIVEFALLAPLLLLVMAVLLEASRMLYHASVIEKSLFSGSEIASLGTPPFDADTINRVTSMVQRGTLDGSGDYLVPGWQKIEADLTMSISYYDLNGEPVPVVTLSTTVPYPPLLPGLTDALGLADVTMEHAHAQIIH